MLHSLKPALSQLMQSLQDLTDVRDYAALDAALLALIRQWLALFALPSQDMQLWIFRQREIVSGYLAHQHASVLVDHLPLPASVNEQLHAWRGLAHRSYQVVHCAAGTYHFFPLTNSLIYKQAALVVRHTAFTAEDVQLIMQSLQMFHGYTCLMLENERDSLTGLLNRKRFDDSVGKIVWAQSTQEGAAGQHYLAIFDLDHFKRINDGFGHAIGDEVLLMMSQLMQKTFRERDLLFRFGGEEFVGIFACENQHDIHQLLERFRTILAAFSFPQVGNVTVSIGYAPLSLNELPNVVLAHADEALYYAKAQGRNQVCAYETLKAAGVLSDAAIQGEIELF